MTARRTGTNQNAYEAPGVKSYDVACRILHAMYREVPHKTSAGGRTAKADSAKIDPTRSSAIKRKRRDTARLMLANDAECSRADGKDKGSEVAQGFIRGRIMPQ